MRKLASASFKPGLRGLVQTSAEIDAANGDPTARVRALVVVNAVALAVAVAADGLVAVLAAAGIAVVAVAREVALVHMPLETQRLTFELRDAAGDETSRNMACQPGSPSSTSPAHQAYFSFVLSVSDPGLADKISRSNSLVSRNGPWSPLSSGMILWRNV